MRTKKRVGVNGREADSLVEGDVGGAEHLADALGDSGARRAQDDARTHGTATRA